MRFNYDDVKWQFVARILKENSTRLSRTRGGESSTATSPEKQPLLLQGEALRRRAAANERRVQRFLFRSRHDPAPPDGKAVLDLLWQIADLTNDGLLPSTEKLRTWPSHPEPPAPPGNRVEPASLAAALEQFAGEVHRRWPELAVDPVPLASWAEWELNGGSLHPFYDGCGRISRAFGAMLLLRASWMLPLYQDQALYFAHGHRGPKGFADYVRRRITACTRWVGGGTGVQELPLTWPEIEGYLTGLEGFSPQQVKNYFKEDVPAIPATEGKAAVKARPAVLGWRLFFKVQYGRGEVIIPKGAYSDYAALHLQGVVRVSEEKPSPPPLTPGCWDARARGVAGWAASCPGCVPGSPPAGFREVPWRDPRPTANSQKASPCPERPFPRGSTPRRAPLPNPANSVPSPTGSWVRPAPCGTARGASRCERTTTARSRV